MRRALDLSCIGLALGLLMTAPVQAFCYEPSFHESTPSAPGTFAKPSVPFCLSSYSYTRQHTCSSWELSAYQSDVEQYIRRLNTYIDEASRFARQAIQFAEEAAAYARCEAREVNNQHD